MEHEAVDFVTWPYEWPFSMLKDAALLQLQVLEAGARNGWLLKDATSFNVQWMGVRPVFIDIPSFVPWEEGEYCGGIVNSAATFLTPLLLTAHPGHPVPAAAPLAPSRVSRPRSKPVLPWAGAFQSAASCRMSGFPPRPKRAALRSAGPRGRQPKTMLFALWDSLRRLIVGLSSGPARSTWSQYAQNHSYDAARLRTEEGLRATAHRGAWPWADLGSGREYRCVRAYRRRALGDGRCRGRGSRCRRLALSRGAAERAAEFHSAGDGSGEPLAGTGLGGSRAPGVRCAAKSRHGALPGFGSSPESRGEHPIAAVHRLVAKLDATCILEFVGRDDEMFQTLLRTNGRTMRTTPPRTSNRKSADASPFATG